MLRQAASTIVIDGTTYHNHVVELDSNGRILNHYPLTHELPHTEWHHHLEFSTCE